LVEHSSTVIHFVVQRRHDYMRTRIGKNKTKCEPYTQDVLGVWRLVLTLSTMNKALIYQHGRSKTSISFMMAPLVKIKNG